MIKTQYWASYKVPDIVVRF